MRAARPPTAGPHGFRSTFRDWAAEQTNYPREVAEAALAHRIPDKVEAAYRAARYRVPAIYTFRSIVADGGLISYGIDLVDQFRPAAGYVDRILKGADPAELPVQLPTKYVMSINLKTAKALGLDVPLLLQQRADEVIE